MANLRNEMYDDYLDFEAEDFWFGEDDSIPDLCHGCPFAGQCTTCFED